MSRERVMTFTDKMHTEGCTPILLGAVLVLLISVISLIMILVLSLPLRFFWYFLGGGLLLFWGCLRLFFRPIRYDFGEEAVVQRAGLCKSRIFEYRDILSVEEAGDHFDGFLLMHYQAPTQEKEALFFCITEDPRFPGLLAFLQEKLEVHR